jgi:HTH-type transcriptional regulator/antitoxin HigA
MRNIRAIRTEADYDWALAEVAKYFDNEPAIGSADGERFQVLLDLIETYENKHYPIESPDPISLIAEYLQSSGKRQADLAALVGSKSRASEIMHRKRALSVQQVHLISMAWRLPADVLVRPYHLKNDNRTS